MSPEQERGGWSREEKGTPEVTVFSVLTCSSRISVFRRRVCLVAPVRDRAAMRDVLLDRAGQAIGHRVTAAAVLVPRGRGRAGVLVGRRCHLESWAHSPASLIPARGLPQPHRPLRSLSPGPAT